MQSLKRRIEQLEQISHNKRIRVTASRDSDPVISLSTTPDRGPSREPLISHGSNTHKSTSGAVRQQGQSTDDDLWQHARGELDHLVLSYMAAEGTPTSEVTPTLSMWQVIASAMYPLTYEQAKVGSLPVQQPRHPPTLSQEEIFPLAQTYCRNILYRWPFMAEDEFMQMHGAITSEQVNADPSPTDWESAAKMFLVYMAVATVGFSSRSAAASELVASKMQQYAAQVLLRSVTRGSALVVLRCLTSACLCALHSTSGGSFWQLLGITISKAISFGLHRLERSTHHEVSAPDFKEKQRLFWVLFILDR